MKEKIITILIFFVVVASIFFFGFQRLGNFSGVDEPYWSYGRVPNFWNAVKKMKWEKTDLCDKPGITLAMVSGAGLPFLDQSPKAYKYLRYEPKTPAELGKIRNIYFWLRLPVFLFTLATLPAFYFLIKKLLGKIVARFSLLFVGLSPVLLGISLIINSDAMLWILTALSTLGLFIFFKTDEKKYLVLSGFLLGLSVITKYVANVLFVYFFLVFLLEYVFYAHKRLGIGKYLKQALANYAILFATAMTTAFVFFPATWVDCSKLLKATVGNDVFSATWPFFAAAIGLAAIDTFVFKTKGSAFVFDFLVKYRAAIAKAAAGLFLFLAAFVFLHVWARLNIFDLQAIIASPKGIGEGGTFQKYGGAISADIFSLLFSVSPLVLVALLFAAGSIWKKKELGRDSITIIYILIFIFVFYLGSAVNSVVTTVRYQIMVYPLAFVIAAIGVSRFFETEKIKKNVPLWAGYAVAAAVLLASLAVVKPHYLAYASEILPENFIVNLKGMGEGSIEAATWLNSRPGARDMVVWSDKGAVCERFVGKCFINFERKTFEQNDIRYFVVSTDRRSRSLKMSRSIANLVDFKKIYASDDQAWKIIIDNNPNDFVKVFESAAFLNKK